MLTGYELRTAAQGWWGRATAGLFGARNGRVGQRQVAALMGTSQGRLWEYEHAVLHPQMPMAVRWANAVGCTLAIQGRLDRRVQTITVREWNAQAGRNLAAIRRQMWFMDGPYAGRRLAHTTMAEVTGMPVATIQRVESAGSVVVTNFAAYAFAIGWEPILLGRDGVRACHTR